MSTLMDNNLEMGNSTLLGIQQQEVINMINYESVSSGSNPSNDSLALPVSDLDGITDLSELGNSQAEDDAKISSAIFLAMHRAISGISNPFGVSANKPNINGNGSNVFRQPVNITWNYVLDNVNREAKVYPVSGGSSDAIAFTDVFPNAEVIGTADTASADSVAIPASDLQNYDANATVSSLQGSLGNDQRNLLEAMTRWLNDVVDVRGGSTSSGVTAKNRNNGSAQATPNNFFSRSSFDQSQEPNLTFISQSISMTHEYSVNNQEGTFELRVTTS